MDNRTAAAFAGAVVIGGANFVAVTMSNEELPPLFGATLRFALGSLLFFVIARAGRVPPVRGRRLVGAVLYGVLGFGAAYALLYYALVGLAVGITSAIVATVPLFTLALAVLLGQERLTMRGVVGGTVAIVGIAVLSSAKLGGDLGLVYVAAAVLGAIAIAASSVVAKANPGVHPVSMNTIGMVAGTILLAVSSLAWGERWALPREPRTLAAVAWLVVFGAVGLFQLFLYVIKRLTASATVYAVAAMPVVAVGLGALILGQPITTEVLVGGLLVMTAVYIGAVAGRA
jgi:drug/metabolite transporter (DMT)-like permease